MLKDFFYPLRKTTRIIKIYAQKQEEQRVLQQLAYLQSLELHEATEDTNTA